MTDVELVKSRTDIVDLISGHVTLKRAGRHFKANCPFHSEKTPSFVVSPERQSWHCFGACAEGGDVISFLQKWENIEFPEALKILADRAGVKLESYKPDDRAKLKERLFLANTAASGFYNYILTSHKLGKKAMEYLKERGISEKTVKTFLLGYAPDSWDSLTKYLLKKGFNEFEINTAGLNIKSDRGSYYDRFRGRLMFTLKDHRGNIVGFSGRKLPPQNEKEAKYINTQETPIYIKGNVLYGMDITKDSIKKANEAVAVEGEFDMLSSFQSGLTNVVAIKGSALTEGQVMLIKRFAENIKLALDSDIAGNEAAKRGIEIADNAGLNIKVVKVLYGKDPADCVAKAPHLWKESVEKAVPVYDFIIDNAVSKYNSDEISGKTKIGQETAPFISKISNPIVKSHYVKKIAKLLSVSEESVETLLEKNEKLRNVPHFRKAEDVKPVKREELLEEHIISLIIFSGDVKSAYGIVTGFILPEDFNSPAAGKIYSLFGEYFKKNDSFEIKKFSGLLSSELNPFFDRIYLSEIKSKEDGGNKDLMHTAREMKKISLRRKLSLFSTKLQKQEEKGDDADAENTRIMINNILLELQNIEKTS